MNTVFCIAEWNGRRGKYGGTLNLNNRTKGLNIYGDFSSRHDYTRQNANIDWAVLIDDQRNRTTSFNDRKAYTTINSGSIGFDWNLTGKTSIGGLLNIFDRRWTMDALGDITQTRGQDPATYISMNTVEENDWLQLLGNVNFKHDFNKNYSLSADFDRIDYNSDNPTIYYQDFFDNARNPTTQDQLQSGKETGIDIWTTAIDFTGRINERVTLEIGAKGSFTSLKNDIVVETLHNGAWTFDNGLTSYATMTEDITAGYASARIKASEKMDVQLGIRYEHTITNIDTRVEENVVDRNFGKWFPTVFLNRRMNQNNSWVASYSRRISRPSFFQLAPFVIFNDPNNFF